MSSSAATEAVDKGNEATRKIVTVPSRDPYSFVYKTYPADAERTRKILEQRRVELEKAG